MKMQATLTFEAPPASTNSEIRNFIKDALETWGGQFHPQDPLFISLKKVRVKFTKVTNSPSTKERKAMRQAWKETQLSETWD